jgi:hypothetical protein
VACSGRLRPQLSVLNQNYDVKRWRDLHCAARIRGFDLGKFTIAGRVVDAEVTVGKTVVHTGVNEEFELTVRKRRAYVWES